MSDTVTDTQFWAKTRWGMSYGSTTNGETLRFLSFFLCPLPPSLKASSAASETLSSVSQTLSTEAISAAAETLSDVSEAIPLSSRPKEDDVL